ncbi:MAG: stress responsive alpha-beta barrel domain-containing protein [Syntrophobacteraceae bacterium CG2_30_61_12]|nr:MAG: stress responsive alpha-beta barrel domain-containing protein [Syntrophobacteraceae bacterium CG2_30_61_12]
MLKHVVLMKFKKDLQPGAIDQLEQGLGALPAVIGEIKQYEFGRDVIGSERSYDFALISGFDDLAAMKRYQAHPEHQQVLRHVLKICDGILAVDFEV